MPNPEVIDLTCEEQSSRPGRPQPTSVASDPEIEITGERNFIDLTNASTTTPSRNPVQSRSRNRPFFPDSMPELLSMPVLRPPQPPYRRTPVEPALRMYPTTRRPTRTSRAPAQSRPRLRRHRERFLGPLNLMTPRRIMEQHLFAIRDSLYEDPDYIEGSDSDDGAFDALEYDQDELQDSRLWRFVQENPMFRSDQAVLERVLEDSVNEASNHKQIDIATIPKPQKPTCTREGHTRSLDPSFTFACERCESELGVPSATREATPVLHGELRTDPATESARVFARSCGHLYCGHCFKLSQVEGSRSSRRCDVSGCRLAKGVRIAYTEVFF